MYWRENTNQKSYFRSETAVTVNDACLWGALLRVPPYIPALKISVPWLAEKRLSEAHTRPIREEPFLFCERCFLLIVRAKGQHGVRQPMFTWPLSPFGNGDRDKNAQHAPAHVLHGCESMFGSENKHWNSLQCAKRGCFCLCSGRLYLSRCLRLHTHRYCKLSRFYKQAPTTLSSAPKKINWSIFAGLKKTMLVLDNTQPLVFKVTLGDIPRDI